MDIVVEKGNVDVGNTAEPSYEVVARSGCSAQLSTNDTDEHELESEDSKVSVGNAAKQSHDVVGVGIDCIFNHVKVSTEADLGPQPDVIHLTSLDVPNESSQISSDADMVKQNQQDALDTLIRISQHKKPKKLNVARVVSEDYKCTPEDVQLIEYIKTLPGKQVVLNIDSAWLNRNDMECLFHGDMQLSDNALNAYIHCIKGEEHLLHREGGKVFLENTFISSLLKRDGDPKVFLPMNIEDFHWYLAVLNAKKSELKGLERQIKLAAKHKELYQGKWSNLDVASWPVIEKITTQMQTDGVSCGLWMINYMEYWTGSSLSDNVTQDDITMFMFKLPAILWDSRLNTKKGHQNLDHNVDEDGESSSDVQIIDTPYINMLAKLLECWPDMEYDVSDCKQILLPFSFLGHFTLYVLNMDTRSIYIMDSMPIPSWYDGDSTIGHRLYTEDVTVNFKHNWMGKGGRLTKPVTNIYWETVATNLDEFLEISEKLSRKGRAESINSGCHAASDCEWSSCGRRSAITVAKKEPARPSGAPAPLDAGDGDRWMPRRE
uniref:Ubiquitin-like protease family profile domain-containing protein n=1 Tax=Zea mays TaxID=4577 RepID=A0A804QEM6_MAIZE